MEQSSTPSRKTYKQGVPEDAFQLKITLFDGLLLVATVIFFVVALVSELNASGGSIYLALKGMHHHLSRYGMVAGLGMALVALFIGFVRKDDVTAWFRRGAYIIIVTMLIQAVLGFTLMFGFGAQPFQPEHVIYGIATAACLPFFVFVETTAKKRPAMGSYIWGFVLLVGIVVRAIGTGAAG